MAVGALTLFCALKSNSHGTSLYELRAEATLPPLELLRPRTNIDLLGPGAAWLPMQLQIDFRDRARCEQGVLTPLRDKMPIPVGLDLSVNNHERDMDALGPQLTGHALGERAQAELRNR